MRKKIRSSQVWKKSVKEIVEGKILFTVEDEDIHMGIESRLIDKNRRRGQKSSILPEVVNDQCQVDIRLYLRKRNL